jgi:hypothetical protein
MTGRHSAREPGTGQCASLCRRTGGIPWHYRLERSPVAFPGSTFLYQERDAAGWPSGEVTYLLALASCVYVPWKLCHIMIMHRSVRQGQVASPDTGPHAYRSNDEQDAREANKNQRLAWR